MALAYLNLSAELIFIAPVHTGLDVGTRQILEYRVPTKNVHPSQKKVEVKAPPSFWGPGGGLPAV